MRQFIISRFESDNTQSEISISVQGHTKAESDGNHIPKTQLTGGNLINLLHEFVDNFTASVDMIIEISDALKSQYFLQYQCFSH